MIPGIPEGAAGSHLFDYLRFFSPVSRFRQVCPPPLHLLSFVFFIQPALSPGLHPISLHSILSGLLPIALSTPFLFHILIHSITTLRPSTYSSSSSSSTIFPPLLLPSTLAPEVPYSVVRCLVTPSPCDDARMLRRATTRKNG